MTEPVHTMNVGEEKFYLYDPDTPANFFGPYEPFVQLWQTKRTDKRLPGWKDFTFEVLIPWVGKMALVDLLPGDIIDGTYRLFGADWVKISKIDLTGKRYTDVITDNMRAVMDPYHKTLLNEGLIGRRVTTSYLEDRMSFYKVDMLDVVLSDNGNTATQYLGFANIIKDKRPS